MWFLVEQHNHNGNESVVIIRRGTAAKIGLVGGIHRLKESLSFRLSNMFLRRSIVNGNSLLAIFGHTELVPGLCGNGNLVRLASTSE